MSKKPLPITKQEIRNNQKRRLACRGGRRKPKTTTWKEQEVVRKIYNEATRQESFKTVEGERRQYFEGLTVRLAPPSPRSQKVKMPQRRRV